MDKKSCCLPRTDSSKAAVLATRAAEPGSARRRDSVYVRGGTALLGTRRPVIAEDGEGPATEKRVRDLWWERGATSVAQFKVFVAATGYVTVAERVGWSFVFYRHVPGGPEATLGVDGLEWWRQVEGASWSLPFGPDGAPCEADMPATHIGHEDAAAFASWAGGRLPREVEWEHAARGGLGDVRYPWGDEEPDESGFMPCNIWQGRFPFEDTGADGYAGPAPVLSFAPNGYGLHNMVGNVWEWTGDPFRIRSIKRAARQYNQQAKNLILLKGGSFLCHRSYCHRYRIAARTGNTPDSTSSHTGFRVVYDRPPQDG